MNSSATSSIVLEYDREPLQYLALYLHLPAIINDCHALPDVNLVEFYSTLTSTCRIRHVTHSQSPRFVFHLLSNTLKLSLRSEQTLLELCFSTRDMETSRGIYYKWNAIDNIHQRYHFTIEIDRNLLQELNRHRTTSIVSSLDG
jgi:hypothetical protein